MRVEVAIKKERETETKKRNCRKIQESEESEESDDNEKKRIQECHRESKELQKQKQRRLI